MSNRPSFPRTRSYGPSRHIRQRGEWSTSCFSPADLPFWLTPNARRLFDVDDFHARPPDRRKGFAPRSPRSGSPRIDSDDSYVLSFAFGATTDQGQGAEKCCASDREAAVQASRLLDGPGLRPTFAEKLASSWPRRRHATEQSDGCSTPGRRSLGNGPGAHSVTGRTSG